jgi:hypothetical protein
MILWFAENSSTCRGRRLRKIKGETHKKYKKDLI